MYQLFGPDIDNEYEETGTEELVQQEAFAIFAEAISDLYPPKANGVRLPNPNIFPHPPTKKLRTINLATVEAKDLELRADEAPLLNPQQRDTVNQLLQGNQDIFSPGGEPTPYGEHRIRIQDQHPISSPPYRCVLDGKTTTVETRNQDDDRP